jgi:hypothetical protein
MGSFQNRGKHVITRCINLTKIFEDVKRNISILYKYLSLHRQLTRMPDLHKQRTDIVQAASRIERKSIADLKELTETPIVPDNMLHILPRSVSKQQPPIGTNTPRHLLHTFLYDVLS